MTTFLDASALLTLLDEGDSRHQAVAEGWARLRRAGDELMTTNYVVLEALAVCQRRFGMDALRQFVRDFLPLVEVLRVDEDADRHGLALLLAEDQRDLSLVDCTSFVLMDRRGIQRAFTLDRHFRERGFECVP